MASRRRITYAPKGRKDRRQQHGKIKVEEINQTLTSGRKISHPQKPKSKKDEDLVHATPPSYSEETKRIRKLQLILQVGTTHWVHTPSGKRIIFLTHNFFRTR
jgi:hypothetical protein